MKHRSLGRTGLKVSQVDDVLDGDLDPFMVATLLQLAGDPTAIYRAIAHDPLTSAVLSLAEIRQMTNELFAQHKDYLPQFKYHTV